MHKLKNISLILLVISYIGAGINHFRVPAFYISIIPAYLPYPRFLNILAGTCEVCLGILLIFAKTRRLAAWGIVLMLTAFLPVHIGMLSGHTHIGNNTVKPIWAWLRLLLQPVLMLWAWWHTREGS